jgi:hypothetical protein
MTRFSLEAPGLLAACSAGPAGANAMHGEKRCKTQMRSRLGFLRLPLLRLLAINLATGAVLAALLVGGLLLLNPSGLRDLILADSSPAIALGLLLFGFVVTFGSTAMGTAIMMIQGGKG